MLWILRLNDYDYEPTTMHHVKIHIIKIGLALFSLWQMTSDRLGHDCTKIVVDRNSTLWLFMICDVTWWLTLDIIRWMSDEQKH